LSLRLIETKEERADIISIRLIPPRLRNVYHDLGLEDTPEKLEAEHQAAQEFIDNGALSKRKPP
jgi:hypothetical protein